mmetsp:Transcript_68381/g.198208  ORF Transcript_68381/g.198208 Transcript_68381/m.198208 type:complete len:936 (+) Transcript_68381:83-2890(+)
MRRFAMAAASRRGAIALSRQPATTAAVRRGLLSPQCGAATVGALRGCPRGCASVPLPEVLAAFEEAAGEEQAFASSGSSSSTAVPKATQGVLWFANIYPTKANRFDIRGALTHHNHEVLIPKLLPSGVEILRMVPREREGGAFVYFRAPPSFVLQVLLSGKDAQAKEKRFVPKGDVDILAKVSDGICQYLKKHNVRAFLVPLPVRAYRVKGDPYLEELQSRFPSSRLWVHVDPAGSLPEEEVYQHLRKYGDLLDITKLDSGKGYSASYQYVASAVAARNCLHRARLTMPGDREQEVVLRMGYEPYMRKWMREAVTSNARYSVPLLIAFMLGSTYLICDPIRNYSVQLRIARLMAEEGVVAQSRTELGTKQPKVRWDSLWSAVVGLLMYLRKASDSIDRASASVGLGQRKNWREKLLLDFWADRDQEVTELRSWLTDPKDQVMLLTGRRGNGQSAFVRDVCGVRGIYLNVAHMLEAGGSFDDRIFLQQLCKPFSYWPTQGMDRQMTALLDLILPGSSKLSRENEALVMVQRVLSCVTAALGRWRIRRLMSTHGWDDLPASGVPLIVIDGFTAENKGRRGSFFESVVTWAAYISEEQLARVLFIADSSFAEPSILAALGNRPERLEVRELHDAKPAALASILDRHFGEEQKACRLTDDEIECIGGRFRDICALAEQVHRGTSSSDAVRRLTQGAESTVRNLLMRGQEGAKWTRPQLWRAVKLLSKATQEHGVPYDVFLFHVFRGDEAALQSMKESNLIAVAPVELYAHHGARMGHNRNMAQRHKVLPGSPLFLEAYRRLSMHTGFTAVLDLEVAKEDIKREQVVLDAYEAELVKLQEIDDVYHNKRRSLTDPNEALRMRKVQLLELIRESSGRLAVAHQARIDAVKALKQRKEIWMTASKEASSLQSEDQGLEPAAQSGAIWLPPGFRSVGGLLGLV